MPDATLPARATKASWGVFARVDILNVKFHHVCIPSEARVGILKRDDPGE
jgi:hypothetical protein